MLNWFRATAPMYRKLSIVFGMQTAMLGTCSVLQWLAYEGRLPQLLSAAICAGITLFGLVTGLALREAIAGPYVATVVRMEALAAGDLASPILFTGYRDCVGRLTKAMFKFREASLEKQRADAALDAERADAEAKRRHLDEERTMAMAIQKHVVQTLAQGLIRFANGDLRWRIKKWFGAEFKTLRMDFNLASENMEETMRRVMTSTSTVEAGAGQIQDASADLARRMEQQAGQIGETAASLDEITGTVRQTSEIAKNAAALASAARQDATASGDVVRDTMNAMAGIETSSQQIANIIGVIDEIAFQTNLLALNAGVEAARAGDAGRGFAVVATEVRALAKRSADAAKEIKAIISASGTQVGNGVKLVNETGQTLLRITAQISRLTENVGAIAEAAARQAAALNKVNIAVGQIGHVTHQNARMIEQAAATSETLSTEASKLSAIVGEFKLTDPSAPAEAYEDGPPLSWRTAVRNRDYDHFGKTVGEAIAGPRSVHA